MVERSIDKKIRTLRVILKGDTLQGADKEGKPHLYKHFTNYDVDVLQRELTDILHDLRLSIKRRDRIYWEDEDGAPAYEGTDDYIFEVLFDKEIEGRLTELLKQLESQAPKREKPLIREKALELIAVKIGDLDTGENLKKFLENCGVDRDLIVYPNTKWKMVFGVMIYLAKSRLKRDEETLSKIIGEATHPLMHNGNEGSALVLRKQFNEYLKYDNMGIAHNEVGSAYLALPNMAEDEAEQLRHQEMQEAEDFRQEQEKEQWDFLCQSENREKISLLRKAYQSLMNVVYVFCENPSHPTVELNNNFHFLNKLVNLTIYDLKLSSVHEQPLSPTRINEHYFYLPFSNLYSAEKYYREQGEELSWQKIRPEMSAMYGDIEDLYREVNGSDILAEPDKQKKLNDIQLYLSELKEKAKEKKEQLRSKKELPTTRIEITKLPPLQFSNPSDGKLGQVKSIPTEKSKYVISVKDREIWVNNYVIGKPHAVGNNFEFFDYVRHQSPNTEITLAGIPDKVGFIDMKNEMRGRRFIKTLNALGFKSEIKKAFFYKVGKDVLYYRGDEITNEDLEKAGVKIPLFLKELEVAHEKIVPNSPI